MVLFVLHVLVFVCNQKLFISIRAGFELVTHHLTVKDNFNVQWRSKQTHLLSFQKILHKG